MAGHAALARPIATISALGEVTRLELLELGGAHATIAGDRSRITLVLEGAMRGRPSDRRDTSIALTLEIVKLLTPHLGRQMACREEGREEGRAGEQSRCDAEKVEPNK